MHLQGAPQRHDLALWRRSWCWTKLNADSDALCLLLRFLAQAYCARINVAGIPFLDLSEALELGGAVALALVLLLLV